MKELVAYKGMDSSFGEAGSFREGRVLGADAGQWVGVAAGDYGSSLPNTVTFFFFTRQILFFLLPN